MMHNKVKSNMMHNISKEKITYHMLYLQNGQGISSGMIKSVFFLGTLPVDYQ